MHLLVEAIRSDLEVRFPAQRKTQRRKLSDLVAAMLEARSANLMELAAALPRRVERQDMRYQYVDRFLSNPLIDVSEVMAPYAREVFAGLCAKGQTLVLMVDQSWINDGRAVLMVSVRIGDRALPVIWEVAETEGNIPIRDLTPLLDIIRPWLPPAVKVMLAGDRFYGTNALIDWCNQAHWSYRLRLKDNLILEQEGGEAILSELVRQGETRLTGVRLSGGAVTNIGVVNDPGHKEPWLIAMDTYPSRTTSLDYGLRWGIESLFSDFKSRGFGLAQTQLQSTQKIARLILVMSVALYWAVSSGWYDQAQTQTPKEKRGPPAL
jgi:hypothetical protein